jgi:hypothetical protein
VRYLAVLLIWAAPLLGQALPEAPSQSFLAQRTTSSFEEPTHRFFEHGNKLRLGVIAGLIVADGISTQHILGVDHGSEMNPLVRPLVEKGASGQVAASVLGYGLSLSGSYLFHRTGHHKLERLMLNSIIVIESECVTSNLVQIGLARH